MMSSRSKRAALLGVFAILYQAILFGWHHHELGFAVRGTPLTLSAPVSGNTSLPGADADRCEICIVVHHQAAAPLAFIASPVPAAATSALYPPDPALVSRDFARAFRARAPPRA
jgi:hypothetical protein